jgi:hypothetical protein
MIRDTTRQTDKAKPTSALDAQRQQSKDNVAELTALMQVEGIEPAGADFPSSRQGFAGLYESLRESGQKPEANSALHPPGHPGVDLMPNGDVFGSYDDLDAYLSPSKLSRRRGEEVMGFEKHHLIEDHWLQHFGFSSGEAPCVAIYADEHMQLAHGSEGIGFELPRAGRDEDGEVVRGVLYDIDTLVEGHIDAYEEMGRPEWAEKLKDYVRDNRERIIKAYEDGTVSWAKLADVARVRKYLNEL